MHALGVFSNFNVNKAQNIQSFTFNANGREIWLKFKFATLQDSNLTLRRVAPDPPRDLFSYIWPNRHSEDAELWLWRDFEGDQMKIGLLTPPPYCRGSVCSGGKSLAILKVVDKTKVARKNEKISPERGRRLKPSAQFARWRFTFRKVVEK